MSNNRRSMRFRLPRPLPAWVSLSALGIGVLLPAFAAAEGAVRILECSIIQTCDAAGNCEASPGAVTFSMEPVTLEADGSGEYVIRYGDTKANMLALSEAGPFNWSDGNVRHTLLASSETQFLWHSLQIDTAPEATIRFLSCTLSQ